MAYRVRVLRPVVVVLAAVLSLAACGTGGDRQSSPPPSSPSSPSSPTHRPSDPGKQETPSLPPPRDAPSADPAAKPLRGVDASHHQGTIDWQQVRADRIDFAYLKATEGSTFVDPAFATNRQQAGAAGLRVGGYHYFSLCSPGAPQAAHFAAVLGRLPSSALPPAVDLELATCAVPPTREDLLREVRAFLDVLEAETHRRAVVYAYPDLEAQYRIAEALDRRQWVRRIGATPPERDWWIWQRDDAATVDGIDGPADVNLMRAGGL